jgi:hypothetical protein
VEKKKIKEINEFLIYEGEPKFSELISRFPPFNLREILKLRVKLNYSLNILLWG